MVPALVGLSPLLPTPPPIFAGLCPAGRRTALPELGPTRPLSAVPGGPLMGTLLENLLCDRQCREDIWPPDIEGQMRNGFRGLRLRKAVIHRPVEMVGNLRDLTGRDERADRDQAPIARRK